MLRLFSEASTKLSNSFCQRSHLFKFLNTPIESLGFHKHNLCTVSRFQFQHRDRDRNHPVGTISNNNYNSLCLPTGSVFSSCRGYSMYVIKWEARKKRRPPPPKDETAHWPEYIHEDFPQQEDNQITRAITTNVIGKVNTQIEEQSHGRLFAVVQLTGRQFKITPEDIIIIQGYWAPSPGDKIRLEKVLLAGSSDFTLLGRPMLPRDLVRIEATVLEKTLSYTKLNFVLKKRKDYRRLRFYKTPYTMVRINTIELDGLVGENKDVEGERPTIF